MLNSASEVDDLTGPSGLIQGGGIGGIELVVEALLGAGKQVPVAVEDGDDGAVPGASGDLGRAGSSATTSRGGEWVPLQYPEQPGPGFGQASKGGVEEEDATSVAMASSAISLTR
jgi:hypothetical protein